MQTAHIVTLSVPLQDVTGLSSSLSTTTTGSDNFFLAHSSSRGEGALLCDCNNSIDSTEYDVCYQASATLKAEELLQCYSIINESKNCT